MKEVYLTMLTRIISLFIICVTLITFAGVLQATAAEAPKRLELRQSEHLDAARIPIHGEDKVVDDGDAVGTVELAQLVAHAPDPLEQLSLGGAPG